MGAGYAGMRPRAATRPALRQLGLVGAVALAVFAFVPVGAWSLAPLAVVGAIFGAQTVWNASRVAEVGEPLFQGRLQAITTMALGLGAALAALWAGPVLDAFGLHGLVGGAIALAVASTAAAVVLARRQRLALAGTPA